MNGSDGRPGKQPIFDPMGRGPAFSLRSKVARAGWQLAWLLLARWTPPPLFGWRRFVLNLFGARIGPKARIYASVRVWWPGNLTIGAGTIIGPRVRLYNQGRIAIGANSVISQGAHLCASSHDVFDAGFRLLLRPIAIGSACWVATEAFVGPGVEMRDGAVLGARAALFEDAGAWTIYRGNPAKAIGTRALRAREPK